MNAGRRAAGAADHPLASNSPASWPLLTTPASCSCFLPPASCSCLVRSAFVAASSSFSVFGSWFTVSVFSDPCYPRSSAANLWPNHRKKTILPEISKSAWRLRRHKMARYDQLRELVNSFEQDFEKFYVKHNKAAGVRVRKHMQELRSLAQEIRLEVQTMKNVPADSGEDA